MDHSQAAEDHLSDNAEAKLDSASDGMDKKKVFPFAAPYKSWTPQQPSGERAAAPARDWSAALDLVNEAYEAIRIAEERANGAEAYSTQLGQYHAEQLRVTEARLTAAEKRAEAAEARAREAEEWLVKFHDTILDGFQKVKTRP
jgi:hypothetical protein